MARDEGVEALRPKSVGASGYAVRGVIAVLGLAGFAILVLSIAALFSFIDTPIWPIRQHLSPADLASSAVAGATLMLAVLTAFLAIETRDSVAATRFEAGIAASALAEAHEQTVAADRHAKIAQETLEASWRPMLVDIPRQWVKESERDRSEVHVMSGDATGSLAVKLWLRNIGSGPAIITRAGIHAGTAGGWATAITSSVVPKGEATHLEFQLPPEPPSSAVIANLKQFQPVTLTVFYTDQGGNHRWRTQAKVARSADTWRIHSLELSEENAEPFAKSGPMFTAAE